MNEKLIEAFKRQSAFTIDKNHAAACAIFEVIFKGNDKLWNSEQDAAWMKKYNKGLYVLANAGLIALEARR